MRIPLILSVAVCALFTQALPVQAAPKSKGDKKAMIAEMAKDKESAMMFLKEMMKSKEMMTMMAKELKADKGFREIYGNATTGGG